MGYYLHWNSSHHLSQAGVALGGAQTRQEKIIMHLKVYT